MTGTEDQWREWARRCLLLDAGRLPAPRPAALDAWLDTGVRDVTAIKEIYHYTAFDAGASGLSMAVDWAFGGVPARLAARRAVAYLLSEAQTRSRHAIYDAAKPRFKALWGRPRRSQRALDDLYDDLTAAEVAAREERIAQHTAIAVELGISTVEVTP